MAQSRTESTRDIYNYGQCINQFPPNTIKAIRQYERIQKKICRQKMSVMFNEIGIYTYIYISWPTVVAGDPKAPFSIVTSPRWREWCYSFSWIAPLILNAYLMKLSVKQEGINNIFWVLLIYIYIYIIIIIIISCWQHGYPWPSLATPPYRSSP